MRCIVPHAAVGCGFCRRSPSPGWRAGSWNASTCLRGLRRSVNRKEGPLSCRARRRHPICPGTSTPALTSTSLIRTTVDRRLLIREGGRLDTSSSDGVQGYRSTRVGQADSLARLSAIQRAIARRAPSLKPPPSGAGWSRQGLVVRTPNIGGAESGACFSYSHRSFNAAFGGRPTRSHSGITAVRSIWPYRITTSGG